MTDRTGPRQTITGLAPATKQPADVTTGDVWSVDLGRAGSPPVLVNRSQFAPGARTCWHTHPHGQILVIEDGLALVQREGGPIIAVPAGSRVTCPPDVRHWHGASPQSPMTQLAMTHSAADGTYADWGPLVTDEEYETWDGATHPGE